MSTKFERWKSDWLITYYSLPKKADMQVPADLDIKEGSQLLGPTGTREVGVGGVAASEGGSEQEDASGL